MQNNNNTNNNTNTNTNTTNNSNTNNSYNSNNNNTDDRIGRMQRALQLLQMHAGGHMFADRELLEREKAIEQKRANMHCASGAELQALVAEMQVFFC
jgi:hypothetical protein